MDTYIPDFVRGEKISLVYLITNTTANYRDTDN